MDFEIDNLDGWKEVIKSIFPHLKHNILLLKGNLGAGKTTFTKYLLEEMGSADGVDSPTYSIVNEYNTLKGKVFHFDLYRMKSVEEIQDIGIEEYIDNGFLSIIEWPEIYEEELYDIPYHEMKIENTGSTRKISFSSKNDRP